jgi:hypothetical protein
MSGALHPGRPGALHAWAKRAPTANLACPACAALAPRMRANTREWINNVVISVVGRRYSRVPIVLFATGIAGFVAGVAVESAVKHICAGSSHAQRESNRIANWRRAIVTR